MDYGVAPTRSSLQAAHRLELCRQPLLLWTSEAKLRPSDLGAQGRGNSQELAHSIWSLRSSPTQQDHVRTGQKPVRTHVGLSQLSPPGPTQDTVPGADSHGKYQPSDHTARMIFPSRGGQVGLGQPKQSTPWPLRKPGPTPDGRWEGSHNHVPTSNSGPLPRKALWHPGNGLGGVPEGQAEDMAGLQACVSCPMAVLTQSSPPPRRRAGGFTVHSPLFTVHSEEAEQPNLHRAPHSCPESTIWNRGNQETETGQGDHRPNEGKHPR